MKELVLGAPKAVPRQCVICKTGTGLLLMPDAELDFYCLGCLIKDRPVLARQLLDYLTDRAASVRARAPDSETYRGVERVRRVK